MRQFLNGNGDESTFTSNRVPDHAPSADEEVPPVQIGPLPEDRPPDFVLVISVHNRVYTVAVWALLDRGANGGKIGFDMRIIKIYKI